MSGALRQSMLDSERMSELRAVFGNHPGAVRLQRRFIIGVVLTEFARRSIDENRMRCSISG